MSNQSVSLVDLLDSLAHFLPSQGPIKDFIHHNTLHSFQDHALTFHEAIRAASQIYGAKEYLPLETYREKYTSGLISDFALRYVLEKEKIDFLEIKNDLFTRDFLSSFSRPAIRENGYFSSIPEDINLNPAEVIHPVLFRLVANYLDQGIGTLTFAIDGKSFWFSLRTLIETTKIVGITKNISTKIERESCESILENFLSVRLSKDVNIEQFLLELLSFAPGWAGLIFQLQNNPGQLFFGRTISILEFTALYVLLLDEYLPRNFRFSDLNNNAADFHLGKAPLENDFERVCRLWHEAFEYSYYFPILASMQKKIKVNSQARSHRQFNTTAQAVFCIDDRECSIRRHLEESDQNLETFGMPGFFSVDAMYLGPYDIRPTKQCPAPLTPQHLISAEAVHSDRKGILHKHEMNFWHRHANHLYSGWLLSHVFGVLALLRLLISVFFPRKSFATASSMMNFEEPSILHIQNVQDKKSPIATLKAGFTVQEMADRVEKSLRMIGLTNSFAPLIFFIGHGSSSTNNPYFAAYDCGACSGRSGGVNARAFAQMANRQDVRSILSKRGLKIPDDSYFIGGVHDTARDEIQFFDEEVFPENVKRQFSEMKPVFAKALIANAQERTRRFSLTNLKIKGERAIEEVKHRSEMLFEPRPEYNHATNALAIVGRRFITEGLFLDRRAFLNSYDPFVDKDGNILNGILSALVPVCGGINLEYYFSRIDSEIYGAGSKLPHNVVSLLGVANGSEGDLRTGLPAQMTEIHDPFRLMIIIEQKKEIVTKVIQGNASVKNWLDGAWVKFVIFEPKTGVPFQYENGKLQKLTLPEIQIKYFSSSLQAAHKNRENIEPVFIESEVRK
ncbi:MAG: DUF2309 domain-containing protein [Leptospiraceae bacterium]|nr:DUF2309 domain-containing protein [Leptospiraceae bacterium]